MATRDILDYNGNIIGSLTLDDDSSELEWSNALQPYAQPPKKINEIVFDAIRDYQKMSSSLLAEIYTANRLAGLTTAQSDKLFDLYGDVILRIREGAFPTALYRLSQKTPQDFVTQELLDSWISKLKSYM